MPTCQRCGVARGGKFPLKDNNGRVTIPQEDRRQWRADSGTFHAEMPLLLNPELDEPDSHLSFYPDGRIYGLTERGKKTIELCRLNRTDLLMKRKEKIDKFRHALKENLLKVVSLQSGKDDARILDLAFSHHFKELRENTKAES
ncbi:MAG: hypothetical protein GY940_16085, partial [bacterium]|nr:hypothetical protein [bacterium]